MRWPHTEPTRELLDDDAQLVEMLEREIASTLKRVLTPERYAQITAMRHGAAQPRLPLWKRIYRRASLWQRFCDRHKIHPLAMITVIVCIDYVAWLVMQCVVIQVTGSW